MAIVTKTISRAYKTELNPTKAQIQAFKHHLGCSRHVYNWGLENRKNIYEETKDDEKPQSLSFFEQCKLLTQYKKEEEWLKDVDAMSLVSSLRDLDVAYKNFFRRIKQGGEAPGFPKFKSHISSFHMHNQNVSVDKKSIRLPKVGHVKLKEKGYLPQNKHIVSCTVSERAGRWYVSLQIDEDIEIDTAIEPRNVVGIDLGVTYQMTLSDGTVYVNPKALDFYLKKLARTQRKLSRRTKGGQNWKKAKLEVAKIYAHIANVREDHINKIVADVTNRYTDIFIENLDVASILQERIKARDVADAGMGMIATKLQYKCDWKGKNLYRVMLGPNFASNRMCSNCGNIKPNKVTAKMYSCKECGFKEVRQVNTSHNLMLVANSLSETLNACGDSIKPGDKVTVKVFDREVIVELMSLNQERPLAKSDLSEA